MQEHKVRKNFKMLGYTHKEMQAELDAYHRNIKMSEMIERAAKAICKTHTNSEATWRLYIKHAKAAIEVMREPTQDMVRLGEVAFFDSSDFEVKDAWGRMIDAALKE